MDSIFVVIYLKLKKKKIATGDYRAKSHEIRSEDEEEKKKMHYAGFRRAVLLAESGTSVLGSGRANEIRYFTWCCSDENSVNELVSRACAAISPGRRERERGRRVTITSVRPAAIGVCETSSN